MMKGKTNILILAVYFVSFFSLVSSNNCDICLCEQNKDDQTKIINCKWKNLDSIPSWSDTNNEFYELTLSDNKISSIPEKAFNGLKVSRIVITSNSISEIHDNAFSGIEEYLEDLTIEFSRMDEFPKMALSKLTKLKSLNLIGVNASSLPYNMFQSLSLLENLLLEKGYLNKISDDDFSYISNSLKVLSLIDNKLKEMPINSILKLKNLEMLKLSSNDITTIKSNSFNYNFNLYHLDLSRNGIHTIEGDAFKGLESSLKVLDLRSNSLSNNQISAVNVLQKLESLDFSYNSISNLRQEIFSKMSNLFELRLEENELKSLKNDNFKGLDFLQKLFLQGNKISDIEDNVFQNTITLKELDLDNQDLSSTFRKKLFTNIEDSLEIISLENTKLDESHLNAIKSLRSLKSLDISKNKIKSLQNFTFQYLNNLEKLILSNNDITSIVQDQLHGMEKSLTSIALNGNSISTIDECVFDIFEKLETIQLEKNPLTCDCYLRWLRQWVAERYKGFYLQTIQWECNDKNRKFIEVSTNEFICSNSVQQTECKTYPIPTPESTEKPFITDDSSPDSIGMIEISFENISSHSISAKWNWSNSIDIDYTNVEYRFKGNTINIGTERIQGSENYVDLDQLYAGKKYQFCLQIFVLNEESKLTCSFFETLADVTVVKASSNIGVIVGCIVGALMVVVAILFVVIYLRFKKGREIKNQEKSNVVMRNHSGRQMQNPYVENGIGVQKFHKPSVANGHTSSKGNNQLVDKLKGFSPEEQTNIMHMLGENGAHGKNVQSVISTRYVPEPTMHTNRGGNKNQFFGATNIEEKLKCFSTEEKDKILELIGEKDREIEIKKGFNAFANDPNIPFMDSDGACAYPSAPAFENDLSHDFAILQINATLDPNLHDYSGPQSEVENYLEPINTDYQEISECDLDPGVKVNKNGPSYINADNRNRYYNQAQNIHHENYI